MKLTLQQLDSHLKQSLAFIYIVSSDEFLLVQEAVESIRKAAIQQDFKDRTLISGDSSDWAKTLYSSTHSISLFSAKQFIELNMHNAKFNATSTKALQDYAEQPTQNTLLLVRTNKIDNKTEKSNWFQSLEKKCIYVPLWPISLAQLPQWILQRAEKKGLTLSKDTAQLIANRTEGNLLAAAQEIEKLILYKLSASSLNDIDFFSDNTRFDVFNLIDSMLAGNKTRSLHILNNLSAENTEPTLILWALTREFRIMAEIMKQLKQGSAFTSLCSKFQIYEKRQPHVRAFIQRNTVEKCWDLLLKTAQIDRVIKGLEIGNVWDDFEKMVVNT